MVIEDFEGCRKCHVKLQPVKRNGNDDADSHAVYTCPNCGARFNYRLSKTARVLVIV